MNTTDDNPSGSQESRDRPENVIRLPTRRADPESRRTVNKPQAGGDQEPDRRASVVALAVAAIIVLLGFLLMKELADNSKLDDCIMAGRKNCVPIDVPQRRSRLEPGPADGEWA